MATKKEIIYYTQMLLYNAFPHAEENRTDIMRSIAQKVNAVCELYNMTHREAYMGKELVYDSIHIPLKLNKYCEGIFLNTKYQLADKTIFLEKLIKMC